MKAKISFLFPLLFLLYFELSASFFSPSVKHVDLCLTPGNNWNSVADISGVVLQATASGNYQFKIVRSGDFTLVSGIELNGNLVPYTFPVGSNTAYSTGYYFFNSGVAQDIFVQVGTPGPTGANLNAQLTVSLINMLGQEVATMNIYAHTRAGVESGFTVNGSNAVAPTLIQTYICQGIPLVNQSTGEQYLMELTKCQSNGTGNLGTYTSNGGNYAAFSAFPADLATTTVFGPGFTLNPGYYRLTLHVKRADNICGTSSRTAFIKVNTNSIPLNFPGSSSPWPMVLMNPLSGTTGLEGTYPGTCQYPQTNVGSVTCGFNVYDFLEGVTNFTQLRFSLNEMQFSGSQCLQLLCQVGVPCTLINYTSSWLPFTYSQQFNFNSYTANWFQTNAAANPALFANRTFRLTVSFRNPSVPCHTIVGREFYFKIPAANLGLRTAQPDDMGMDAAALETQVLQPNVFPNPTNGKCQLDLRGFGPATVAVHDIYGRQIGASTEATAATVVLDLSDRPAGTYLVTLRSAQATKTLRLIKQ